PALGEEIPERAGHGLEALALAGVLHGDGMVEDQVAVVVVRFRPVREAECSTFVLLEVGRSRCSGHGTLSFWGPLRWRPKISGSPLVFPPPPPAEPPPRRQPRRHPGFHFGEQGIHVSPRDCRRVASGCVISSSPAPTSRDAGGSGRWPRRRCSRSAG